MHPTTLNEAVDASGKQDLISPVYLQMRLAWAIVFRSLRSLDLSACIFCKSQLATLAGEYPSVCVCLCVCVCVCSYVSQSNRESHPVPQGGREIEWPYIHKDMVCVCVCVYGKRENHPVPQGGGGAARTHSWKTTKPQGSGGVEGMPQKQNPVPQGGGRGEYTMTGGSGGGVGGPPGRNRI